MLPLGGDWALHGNPNGTVYLDVCETFATSDGAFIQVFETGYLHPGLPGGGPGHVRMTFETGSVAGIGGCTWFSRAPN